MKTSYDVTVVVMDDDGIMAVHQLVDLGERKGALVNASVRPDVNTVELGKMFTLLGKHHTNEYYMNRVRTLSREAREAITKALGDDDIAAIDPKPF